MHTQTHTHTHEENKYSPSDESSRQSPIHPIPETPFLLPTYYKPNCQVWIQFSTLLHNLCLTSTRLLVILNMIDIIHRTLPWRIAIQTCNIKTTQLQDI